MILLSNLASRWDEWRIGQKDLPIAEQKKRVWFATSRDSANPMRALNTHGKTGSNAGSADTHGPANREAAAKNAGAIRQEAERREVAKLWAARPMRGKR